MDTRTGEIASLAHFRERLGAKEFDDFIKPIDSAALSPIARLSLAETGRAQIGRNSLCPCGSGKKFKRCCIAQRDGELL